MFPNPNRVTLDQGLDASMDEATIGTQRLAAEAEADNAGNGRPGEAFTWTNQPGLLIDNDMSVDDSLSGLGEDALELSNDHLPTPEELIEEAESEAAARRERSREKFSRGLTAEQEYYQAYTMLDKGLVDGEERREWQLRVQMAMDRLKREKEMQ